MMITTRSATFMLLANCYPQIFYISMKGFIGQVFDYINQPKSYNVCKVYIIRRKVQNFQRFVVYNLLIAYCRKYNLMSIWKNEYTF